ncbi:TetR/AcrR family transcriptional regulator C-terminal domain-containing protein [uncultured Clostridium sp.]|uniref:TetR family transcriptional regulator n=1 Tax=Clostridium sulfidigenes TaxID=318464 RepID=A0A927ZKX0_9CLOT|nr:TetR family transcriptional regulator [Clostridium sulfidigenes]
MRSKKENTKALIVDSFKKLMTQHSFDKITIKMITDEAKLIRPSFYNHFADKYELLEWICYKDIFEGATLLIDNKMFNETILFVLTRIENNKEFYIKAMKIEGQNSFESIIYKFLLKMFEELFSVLDIENMNFEGILTASEIANYYSRGLTYFLITWLKKGVQVPAHELAEKYYLLLSNSLEDIVFKPL